MNNSIESTNGAPRAVGMAPNGNAIFNGGPVERTESPYTEANGCPCLLQPKEGCGGQCSLPAMYPAAPTFTEPAKEVDAPAARTMQATRLAMLQDMHTEATQDLELAVAEGNDGNEEDAREKLSALTALIYHVTQ